MYESSIKKFTNKFILIKMNEISEGSMPPSNIFGGQFPYIVYFYIPT